ncbi:MAG TPA: enoyl-CoA hydratase/isomerase family protein [Candidatus Dormibacteraeota bacterium]|nr:enoyl-CoA hydratase/isomerase family protein [Candidatus Dormibacteraeota bacterium]
MEGLTLQIARGVAIITIDRPHARNALNLATMRSLGIAMDEAEAKRARVLVIRGAGEKAFCAGGDLKELEHMRSAEQAAQMARTMRTTLDRLNQLRMPVIAAVNGDALGGGAELALACDFRIAAAHARIGFPQVNLGLIPAWGAPERLAALVGRARALHIMLTGKALGADEALDAGLVEEVVPSEGFDPRVRDLAAGIAAAPSAAVAGIKRSVDSVRPQRNPELAEQAIEAFARTWAAPAHWRAVEKMEKRRRSSQAGR